jgi:hypothetical protein
MPQGDYPATEFESIDELCSLIKQQTTRWDTRWYRGLKNPKHSLLPKLFRKPSSAGREGYLAVEFRRRARPHLPHLTSQFEWLCAMQHYGIPTRLLDWSESLSVALYFTVRPIGIDLVSPTIWVLDPHRLYALANPGAGTIPISTDSDVMAYADVAFCDEPENFRTRVTTAPLPVAPDFIFNRLATQNGAFTIHGRDFRPLEQLIPEAQRDMLIKFVAKESRVDAIYDCIDLIKPSSDAVFPDIEGLKDYIV